MAAIFIEPFLSSEAVTRDHLSSSWQVCEESRAAMVISVLVYKFEAGRRTVGRGRDGGGREEGREGRGKTGVQTQ